MSDVCIHSLSPYPSNFPPLSFPFSILHALIPLLNPPCSHSASHFPPLPLLSPLPTHFCLLISHISPSLLPISLSSTSISSFHTFPSTHLTLLSSLHTYPLTTLLPPWEVDPGRWCRDGVQKVWGRNEDQVSLLFKYANWCLQHFKSRTVKRFVEHLCLYWHNVLYVMTSTT